MPENGTASKEEEMIKRLSDEAISKAAYERNKLFGENDSFAYTRKPNADDGVYSPSTTRV
ncbi:hypothetical protein ES703_108119 [subsurface metagenome]